MGYAFRQKPVFLLIPIHVPLPLRSPRVLTAIGVGVAAAVAMASYVLTRRKPTAEEMEREIAARDVADSTRAVAPLRPAPDATIIDTDGLEVGEVVDRIVRIVREVKQ